MTINATDVAGDRDAISQTEWRSDRQTSTCTLDNDLTMGEEARHRAEGVRQCLRENDCNELRAFSCEFCDGILTLRGDVATYYHKQLAQECVRFLPGVVAIVNLIVVHHT